MFWFMRKKFCGSVLLLGLLKPLVVRPVRGSGRVARLVVAQIVHIAAGGEEALHLTVEYSRAQVVHRPLIAGSVPLTDDEEVVAHNPVRERRVAGRHAGRRTVEVLKQRRDTTGFGMRRNLRTMPPIWLSSR